MTHSTLHHIASLHVPIAAMREAIMAIHPRADRRARLSEIALRHGGGVLLAQAIALRLSMLGLLHVADRGAGARPHAIPAEVLATILTGIAITVVDEAFSFDGDALAAQLRLASDAGHSA
jgi:hypothetical protein